MITVDTISGEPMNLSGLSGGGGGGVAWGAVTGSVQNQTDVVGVAAVTGGSLVVNGANGAGATFNFNSSGNGVGINLIGSSWYGTDTAHVANIVFDDSDNSTTNTVTFPPLASSAQILAYQSWVTSNFAAIAGIYPSLVVGQLNNGITGGTLSFDGLNWNFGFGTTVVADAFSGDGSQLNGNAASLSIGGSAVSLSSSGVTFSLLGGTWTTIGSISSPSFIGSGAALSGVLLLGGTQNAQLTGTTYTTTNSYASIVGGTTSPTLTIAASGDGYLSFSASSAFVAATFAGVQSLSIKLRRTNNTAADIGFAQGQPLPVITALTGVGPSMSMVKFPYTATAGDVITIQAVLSAAPGAGSVTIPAANIVWEPR